MFHLSHWGLDSALRAVLLLVLAVWAAWWLIALAVAVIDRGTAARIGPPLLRVLLVGGVVAGTVAPAHASRSHRVEALTGLHLPERPVSAPPNGSATTQTAAVHIVSTGESLWAIVAERSPGASDSRIRDQVERWYLANREVIGADPDLILPGQRLDPPSPR